MQEGPTRSASCATAKRDHEITPYGIRTRIAGWKDQHPEPLEERGVSKVVCRVLISVGREALESPSTVFQAAASPSQLPPRQLSLRSGHEKARRHIP